MEKCTEITTWNEACRKIAGDIAELLISKQKDYGKNNILDFGEFGILVRVNDKISRLKNLSKSGSEPKNESIDDTWKEVAGYAIIALII